jgi:hypothetical protein
MNLIRRLGAVLAGALLAIAGVAPAALARPFPPRPPGWDKHPPPGASIRIVFAGGMPGWQIALIAAGIALLAAVLAVLLFGSGLVFVRALERWL